ncbi:hypothetical protein ALC60_06505 [Trachymyrmex zeteki]|uniref:Uncharacterized protein n=1 Tax=Mycetomoellerius zeteki TaxID=64791 RepID=A0A151X2Q5_9HYME|nr:hypothetical protein ALC60_06505 [Trachymyrmex zeteki]
MNINGRPIYFSWIALSLIDIILKIFRITETRLGLAISCDSTSNNQNRRLGIVLGRLQRPQQQCRRHHQGLLKERRAGE